MTTQKTPYIQPKFEPGWITQMQTVIKETTQTGQLVQTDPTDGYAGHLSAFMEGRLSATFVVPVTSARAAIRWYAERRGVAWFSPNTFDEIVNICQQNTHPNGIAGIAVHAALRGAPPEYTPKPGDLVDCAHAPTLYYPEAALCVYSFGPQKPVPSYGGGAIATESKDIYHEVLRHLPNIGRISEIEAAGALYSYKSLATYKNHCRLVVATYKTVGLSILDCAPDYHLAQTPADNLEQAKWIRARASWHSPAHYRQTKLVTLPLGLHVTISQAETFAREFITLRDTWRESNGTS